MVSGADRPAGGLLPPRDAGRGALRGRQRRRSRSGWDGGKKVGGRKRRLVVDCLGLVLAVAVGAVSLQDRDAAVPLLARPREMYFSIRLVWADGGCAGRLADWAAEKHRLTVEVVRRSDDMTGFVVLP
ncbi:transposase [Streptomyces sp. NPDC007027]|uniref:transposase n=1 Tax=unclassified Streptomyces TaxID=2593676 RepID=UPI0033F44256